MDYKVFLHDLDAIKKELLDFMNLRNKRNLSRVDKLVNDYIVAISIEKYSIKSYKAKIIHNELDHHRTSKELPLVKENSYLKIKTLIDDYFKEYSLSNDESIILNNKTKDLREFTQDNRRQKHDVLLKKNNTEKEFALKSKELEIARQDKFNNFNESIFDIKNKLTSAIAKINEKTIASYQESERKLLDCEDIKEIKELKKKIKDARLIGLNEEFKTKTDSYDVLMNEEIKFNQEYNFFVAEIEKYKKDVKIKLIECEKDLNLLNIDSSYKDISYDVEQRKITINKFLDEINNFLEYVKANNLIITKDYQTNDDNQYNYSIDEKLFLYDLLLMNCYRLLVSLHLNSLYDPLTNVLYSVIDSIKNCRLQYKTIYEDNVIKHQEKEKALLEALANYIPNSKKKVTKEDFLDNVTTSLNRYYVNFTTELDLFNKTIFELFNNIINSLMANHDNIIIDNKPLDESKKISSFGLELIEKETNYSFVDLNETGFKTKNENNSNAFVKVNDDNYITLKNKLQSYYEQINTEVENKLEILRNNNANEIKNITEESNKKIALIEKDYKKFIDANQIEIDNKEKEVKKSTSKFIANAKKLLSESISVL